MKKTVLVATILLLLSGTSLFAIGVGAAWTFGLDNIGADTGTAVFQLSHDAIPGTILGLAFSTSDSQTSVGLTNDWWLYKTNISGPLHLAMGPGFLIGGNFTEGSNTFDFGGRVAVDLRFFALDPLEFFFNYSPSVFVSGLGGDSISFPEFNWSQIAIGLRFWF